MPKRVLEGVITSDKGDKTVTLRVERRLAHPVYGKIIRQFKKYRAHDENNSCKGKIGQKVMIEECRPISKTKCWIVKENA